MKWGKIPSAPGFSASTDGQIRNDKTGTIRKAAESGRSVSTGRRHLAIGLRFGESAQYVHRMVLEAFVGPCPEGLEARHLNGNPHDNRLENLQWDTKAENMRDRARHGTHYQAAKTHCPRNHLLQAPNLVPSRAREGYRVCRACMNSRYQVRRYGADHQTESDRVYARIMAGGTRPYKRR